MKTVLGRFGTIEVQAEDGSWVPVGKVNNAEFSFKAEMTAYDSSVGGLLCPISIEDRKALVEEAIELLRPKQQIIGVQAKTGDAGVISYNIEYKKMRRGKAVARGRVRRRLGGDSTSRRAVSDLRKWRTTIELHGSRVADVSWDDE